MKPYNQLKTIFKLAVICLLFLNNAFGKLPAEKPDSVIPVIFNFNEGALPGEAFNIQGHFLNDNCEVWYSLIKGDEENITPEKQLEIISSSKFAISAKFPEEKLSPIGKLIAIWVKSDENFSSAVFINRARIQTVEFDEVMPGTCFRVFGRNLFFPGQKPELSFYNPVTKKTYKTEIIQQDPYFLQAIAPENLEAGLEYKICVNNGSGGKWGTSYSDETILGRKKAQVPFSLKSPWGADFDFHENVYNIKTDSRLKIKAKGDGRFNDREAIQNAINQANEDGGGVVFFPKGLYKIDFEEGCGLTMKSKVVLQGENPESSVIQYGFGKPQSYIDPIGKSGWPDETINGVAILWPLNTELSGLYRLGIQNLNKTGLWRHSLKSMRPNKKYPGSAGSKYFAVDCHFNLSMDWGLSWGYIDKMVISGCVFNSKAQVTWPWLWHCDGSTNFVVSNNHVRYSAGRFGFSESYNGIIENNHITRLGDLQPIKGESGGFNIDYAKDIVVLKNHMDVEGEAIQAKNQGETILSQGCNPVGQTLGKVTSATKLSVTDMNNTWPKFGTNETNQKGDVNASVPSYSNAIAIINGKGTGQWRYITKNDSHQLEIDRPWDVIPEVGSQYVIMKWSAEDWLVKDNLLEDNNRGIWFYGGGNDVVIEGNELINSDGIYLRADQRMELGRFNLIWDFLVENNRVLRTNDKRPTYISLTLAVQPKQALLGTGMLGVEVRRNYIQALEENVSTFIRGEGYWNHLGSRTPEVISNNTIGILGTIFDSNTSVNCDYGYRLSKSISQTIIKDPVDVNVKNKTNEASFSESDKINTVLTYSEKEKVEDPFLPYLTGESPAIIKELGEEIENGVKLRKLIFKSYQYKENGQEKAAEIFAIVARPEKEGNYPGLLVLHGGGGYAEIEKAKKWAALGYVVVALDEPGVASPKKIPYSKGPWNKFKYGQNRFVVTPDIKSSTIFTAALASIQGLYLLHSQPDVLKDKIGVVGISWGGYLTTFVSGIANKLIAASFSVYGCGFYDYGTSFLKLLNTMKPDERAIWLKYLDAGRRAKNIKTPFFIAAAANDNWFWPPAVTLTLNNIKGTKNHLFAPNNSHKVELPGGTTDRGPEDPGWLSMEKPYFDYYLKDIGNPLPEIRKIEKIKLDNGNTKIRFTIKSKLPITNATINYSLVGEWWTKRKWETLSAKDTGNGYLEAEVPSNNFDRPFECFATISDSRPTSVSSYLIWCE